jgi:hypothetical protein
MKERPEYRPVIISGLADFILTIPHNTVDYDDHIVSLLFKLAHLLKQWIEILQTPVNVDSSSRNALTGEPAPSPAESEGLDSITTLPTEKIEAFALIFLCAPKKSIRLLSLDILHSLAIISKEQRFKVLSSIHALLSIVYCDKVATN